MVRRILSLPMGNCQASTYVSETISEIIKTKMNPIPDTIMEIEEDKKKEIVILRVLPGKDTPYYYVGDGNRVAYIRVGNESVPVGAMDLKNWY